MLNSSNEKKIAIIILGAIAIINLLLRGDDRTTLAIVGFVGGILVSKA